VLADLVKSAKHRAGSAIPAILHPRRIGVSTALSQWRIAGAREEILQMEFHRSP